MDGIVLALHIAPAAGAPMVAVESVRAEPGRGLEGDRYWAAVGTYSQRPSLGRQVTLIEAEAIMALARDYEIRLAAGTSRRNVLTQGIALNHLVAREFSVGEVLLRGTGLCEPCGHLEDLTQAGVRRGLVHRGGLRAEILRGGIIRVGDPIRVSDPIHAVDPIRAGDPIPPGTGSA